MWNIELKNHAGQTALEVFEEAVKDLVIYNMLPKDFAIHEINKEGAWGSGEGIVVYWKDGCRASVAEPDVDHPTKRLVYDEDGRPNIVDSYRLHRRGDLDVTYLCDPAFGL